MSELAVSRLTVIWVVGVISSAIALGVTSHVYGDWATASLVPFVVLMALMAPVVVGVGVMCVVLWRGG